MWIKNENGQLKRYAELPKYFKHWAGGFDTLPSTVHQNEGFFPLVFPDYDLDTQKRGSEIIWDEGNKRYTFQVIDKTDEELEQEIQARLEAMDKRFDEQAAKRLLQKLVEPVLQDKSTLTEQDIEDAKMLYKQWRGTGISYQTGDKVVYNKNLYRVLQPHTSQADWRPDTAVSLFTKYRVPDAIEPWVQPAGAHNAYAIEVKVTHNGQTWECTVADNVWEPGVYGWVVVS